MYEVKDGARTLRFEGQLLGQSSSYRRDSNRWIEFALYKTKGGEYILARTGVSLVYHSSVCPLVVRYGLQEIDIDEISENAVPCEECSPNFEEPLLYPEKFRYWTLRSTDPEAVLDALYKSDTNRVRYMTKVAERLLEQASKVDAAIDQLYRYEFVE